MGIDFTLTDAAREYRQSMHDADAARDRLRRVVEREWLAGRTATDIAKIAGIGRQTIDKWVSPLKSPESLSESDAEMLRGVADQPYEWAHATRRLVDRRRAVTVADCSRAAGLTVEAGYARLRQYS